MHTLLKLLLAVFLANGGIVYKHAVAICLAPTLGAELDANRTIVSISRIPSSLARKAGAKEGDKILSLLGVELTEEKVSQIDDTLDEWVRYAREDDASLLVKRGDRVLLLMAKDWPGECNDQQAPPLAPIVFEVAIFLCGLLALTGVLFYTSRHRSTP